jgi:hypothetical protein
MCHHFDSENVRGRAIDERKGKPGQYEAPELRVNGLTDLGMLKQ